MKYVHPKDRRTLDEAFQKSVAEKKPYEIEHRVITKKGNLKYVIEKAENFFDKNGKPTLSRGIVYDVTKRKKAEIDLKQALEVKDVLLKEVHHRVKNNLQTIRSLLFQQQYLSDNPQLKAGLQESINRIGSMALIHEQIYRSDNLEYINIKKYLQEFCNQLLQTYSQSKKNIFLKLEVEDLKFNIDYAIPIALLINELMSNSLKYAFEKVEEGEIFVSLKKFDKKQIKLTFADNGIGLPADFETKEKKSLGMYIIKNVSKRQLKGQMNIKTQKNEGTKYEITFAND